MKIQFLVFLFLFITNAIAAENKITENKAAEWKILTVQGNALANLGGGGGSKALALGQVLTDVENFQVESGALKFLKDSQEWFIFSNSDLDFSGENPNLKKGSLRIILSQPGHLKLDTPVAQVNMDGSDFIIIYHADRGRLEVSSLEGRAWVKGIYREEDQRLEKNTKGGFQGVMEKDGPAFDQMLQGKKIVRGDLLAVQNIKPEELENLKKTYYLENQKIIVKEKPKPKKGQICSEPFAKLDECVWRLKAGKCTRERCYASGEWGDITMISDKQKDQCGKRELKVAPCDY